MTYNQSVVYSHLTCVNFSLSEYCIESVQSKIIDTIVVFEVVSHDQLL